MKKRKTLRKGVGGGGGGNQSVCPPPQVCSNEKVSGERREKSELREN
jgi:hypothetical protein